MDLLYNILMVMVAVVGLPFFAFRFIRERRFRERLRHNLGFFPPETLAKVEGKSPVWFQSAGVGEVVAASSIIREFKRQRPDVPVLISSGTASGYEMAQRIIPEADAIIFYPPDLPGLPHRIVDKVHPRLYVLVETELWPNFLRAARKRSIPVVMVNGRIGERNVNRYRQMRRLFTKMLNTLELFCMQSTIDAQYIIRLGADPRKVIVTGNTKYDQNYSQVSAEEKQALLAEFGFAGSGPVFVAGSTHRGEEEILMEALKEVRNHFPQTKLLLAPRDIPRCEKLLDMVRRQGLTAQLRSGISGAGTADVIILDTIGELGRLYSLADIVFVGGSLIPHGGHNILEPAAQGKPIIVGPHMYNFKDTYAIFSDRNACVTVLDGKDLAQKLTEILADLNLLEKLGKEAIDIVKENQGAALRTVGHLRQILEQKQ